MRKVFTLTKLPLLIAFVLITCNSSSQAYSTNSPGGNAKINSAVNFYHQFLFPEPGLYNGSEYTYYQYYPFSINEGDPYFLSKSFTKGDVCYDGVLYQNVPLLFDLIQGELLIPDPSGKYIIKLNRQRVNWFSILNHSFIHLHPDSTDNSIQNNFYELLYKGNISLYKKIEKVIKENSASAEGINRYISEKDEYLIKKESKYYRINNKKTLLLALSNRKKEVQQFLNKNKLKVKKDEENAFIKAVAFYDKINKNNSQAIDQ